MPIWVGTRAALRGRVDPVLYGLKRAYHSTLRVSRRDFKAIELTPARMDILHALYNRGRWRNRFIWQSALRRIIGYTARSTMTQIMQALEALGWVRRTRSRQDKRQLEVELTEAGREQYGRAACRFLNGWSVEAPMRAKNWAPPDDDESRAWEAYIAKLTPLRKILLNIRIALRDIGSLRYQWLRD